MAVEERPALTHARAGVPCLVQRFARCPHAQGEHCARCSVLEQACAAAALARGYARQPRR